MSKNKFILIFLVAFLFVTGCQNKSDEFEYPQTNKAAPFFILINQHGQKISLNELKGNPFILSFAFSHCAAICPRLVDQLNSISKKTNIKLVLITLDPWRDTPGKLMDLFKRWQLENQSHILSGNVEDVLQTLKDYNMPLLKDEKTGQIDHPGLVYVINATSQIVYTFNNPSSEILQKVLTQLN